MPSNLAAIDPKIPVDPPPHFHRIDQAMEDTVFSIVTSNGYRVTIIASAADSYTEHGFVNPLHQFINIVAENDPRAHNPEKYNNPSSITEENKYAGEQQAITPRLNSIAGAFFDEFAVAVPKHYFFVITKVEGFKELKDRHDSLDPSDTTLKNGLGRHPVIFSQMYPQYYQGRGKFIQSNMLGVPAVGHNEKFVFVESPHLKPRKQGYPEGYDDRSVFQDMVANVANALEALGPNEEVKGVSITTTPKVAELAGGQQEISSVDFLLTIARTETVHNPETGEKIVYSLPYTTQDALRKDLVDYTNRSLYVPKWNDDQDVTGKRYELSFYTTEVSERFGSQVRSYEFNNQLAALGEPSHVPYGSGKMIEIGQIPQYIGEPLNLKVGPYDPSKGLTHSQQMRNYLCALANSRILSPTGVDITERQQRRVHSINGVVDKRTAQLISTNPQKNPGPHFKGVPEMVMDRTAHFTYQVIDTPLLVSERAILLSRLKDTVEKPNPFYTWDSNFHITRSMSNDFAVTTPTAGLVYLDFNLAMPHELEKWRFISSARHYHHELKIEMRAIGKWMDRGVVFGQQRVVTAALDSGGLPLYSTLETQFTRRWKEREGRIIRKDGSHIEYSMAPVIELENGDIGPETRRKLRAASKDGKPLEGKLKFRGIRYAFKHEYIPSLGIAIPILDTHKAYVSKNDYDDSSHTMRARSEVEAMMYEAQAVNVPVFYGRDFYQGKKAYFQDSFKMVDKNGKPFYRPKYAVGAMYYVGEEDYRRAGVFLKREMRYFDAAQDEVMMLLGYKVSRKESGHDWAERASYLPINYDGTVDTKAKKISRTSSENITFEWENRKIYEYDPKLHAEMLKLIEEKFGGSIEAYMAKHQKDFFDAYDQEAGDLDSEIADRENSQEEKPVGSKEEFMIRSQEDFFSQYVEDSEEDQNPLEGAVDVTDFRDCLKIFNLHLNPAKDALDVEELGNRYRQLIITYKEESSPEKLQLIKDAYDYLLANYPKLKFF